MEAKSSTAFSSAMNSTTKVLKDNQVVIGVATTYITGSTIAYYSAGVAFKTALAYSVGVAMVYGALGYGAYRLLKSSDE